MSFHTTTSQSAYPTTTKDTSTTTTSTISTAQLSASSIPTINTRQTGGHAKSLGLDWSAPTDRATYLQLVDLPEIFGAVLNNDWETAGKLTIKPARIGDYWMPLAIQSHSITNAVDDHLAPWADDLPSKNKKKQQWAIIDMAHDKVHKTTVDGAGSVYGANLLTLCLGMRAPTAFLQKVITLSKEHAPRHLNKPDASGKTPLYVAIQQGDLAAVQMLLDAGADWRTRSKLIKYDGTKGGPANVTWDLGTTAVTSATVSPETCSKKNVKAAMFIRDTYAPLVEDVARGQGEHLTAALDIFECPREHHSAMMHDVRAVVVKAVIAPGFNEQQPLEKATQLFNIIDSKTRNTCGV